jgi:hypothetical protein
MPEIEVQGLGPLLGALDQFEEIAAPELRQAANAAFMRLIEPLATYPAARPGQAYVRTGTLGRRWSTAIPDFAPMASGFEASLTNNTPYAPEVQGDPQGRYFTGRWKPAAQVLKDNTAQIEAEFQAAGQRIAQKIEGRG